MSASGYLDSVQFADHRELGRELADSTELRSTIAEASFEEHRRGVRKRLLATAVRVDPRSLPKLDASIRAMKERAHYEDHVEAYVFEDPSINAFLTKGIKHTYLGLSSGAVNNLSESGLSFVIGHELGHALFGDADFTLRNQLDDDDLQPGLRRKLLAWQRASEISADRCGLVCCQSIEVGATALFRSLSGLTDPGLRIRPDDFSQQWDHLLAEVISHGTGDMWQATHPFPPMRMKAMVLFWQSDCPALPDSRKSRDVPLAKVDEEISRLLATLDPAARAQHGSADPLLEDIILWAGLSVVHAGDQIHQPMLDRLREQMPGAMAAHGADGELSRTDCLAHLRGSLELRHKRLKSLEIHRVLQSVLSVAPKGSFADREPGSLWSAFCDVGKVFGIDEHGCETVRERFRNQAGATRQ